MKNISKKLSIIFLLLGNLVSCDNNNLSMKHRTIEKSIEQLETEKENLFTQFQQCGITQEKNVEKTASQKLTECQKNIADSLGYIERQMFRKKYGSSYDELNPYINGYWYMKKNNRYGIINQNGEIVIEPKYQGLGIIQSQDTDAYYPDNRQYSGELYDYFMQIAQHKLSAHPYPVVYLKENNLWGGINLETGEIVLPFKYTKVKFESFYSKNYLILNEESKNPNDQIIVNANGRIVLHTGNYDDYAFLSSDFIQVRKGNKIGIVRYDKEIIPLAENIDFSEDNGIIKSEQIDQETGERIYKVYSIEGKLIATVKDDFTFVKVPSKNMNVVIVKDPISTNLTIFNKEGDLIEENIEYSNEINDRFLAIRKGNQYGLINQVGKLVLDFHYDYFSTISSQNDIAENYFVFQQSGKKGVFDNNLNIIVPAKYDAVEFNSQNQLIKVKSNEKYGVINLKGTVILEPIYSEININNEGVFIVYQDKKAAIFSPEGNDLTGFVYHNSLSVLSKYGENKSFFPNGAILATNLKDNTMGILDFSGHIIVPFHYQHLKFEENNLILFKSHNQYGVIDYNGNVIIKPQYQKIKKLSKDRYIITKNNLVGLIDDHEKNLIPLHYESVEDMLNSNNTESQQYYLIKKSNQFGIFDVKQGKEVISPKFPYRLFFYQTDNEFMTYPNDEGLANDDGIVVNLAGDYIDTYQARLTDNKTLFNFSLPEKITILSEPTSGGKQDFLLLKSLLDNEFKAIYQTYKKNIECYEVNAYVYSPCIGYTEENYLAKKNLIEKIQTLPITDSEINDFAKQVLNVLFMHIQYDEATKPIKTNEDFDMLKQITYRSNYDFLSIEREYIIPINIAQFEMRETMEKLLKKYQ